MTSVRWFAGIVLAMAAGLATQIAAQLQTDVPPPVGGAKPVTVEPSFSLTRSTSFCFQGLFSDEVDPTKASK